MEILKKMQKSKIFEEISENDLKALHFCFKTRVLDVKKGDVLIDEGQPFESIVLVLDGHLRSIINDYFGNTSILSDYRNGETIGVEEAFSGNTIAQYTLMAIEDTQVLTMNKYSVMKPCENMCPRHTKFQNNLVKIISQKNIELMQKFSHMTKSSTKEKVLSYLQYVSKQQNSKYFDIPFNRQELADYLSVDRSALSFELSKLKAQGIIDFTKNHFMLK
ncbi:MAG: Crp/Fnr family transcriptional regulator [Clostridia bacterium]|nr:Crp/Fnr family transcriptional regulator [Clostridia bacterium]